MNGEVTSPSIGPLDHELVMRTVNNTPPLPETVVRINNLYSQPEYRITDIAAVLELDPALCGRLVRMANSAIYGPGQVAEVAEAVVRLGEGTVKSVAVAECLRPSIKFNLSTFGLTPFSFWRHGAAVVSFAKELMLHSDADFGEGFLVAAVLHDFGKIILAQHAPALPASYMPPRTARCSASEFEMQVLGLDHAEVGAAVAQHWDLPEPVVWAIQYHHRPEMFDHPLCYGLCLANQLARRIEGRDHEAGCGYCREMSIEALNLNERTIAQIRDAGTNRFRETLDSYI